MVALFHPRQSARQLFVAAVAVFASVTPLAGAVADEIQSVLPDAAPFRESAWQLSPQFGLFLPVPGTD